MVSEKLGRIPAACKGLICLQDRSVFALVLGQYRAYRPPVVSSYPPLRGDSDTGYQYWERYWSEKRKYEQGATAPWVDINPVGYSVVCRRVVETNLERKIEKYTSDFAIPNMLLAIDPGVDQGWALFRDGQLVECGLGNPFASLGVLRLSSDVEKLIVEVPRIYPGGRTKNPQALISLTLKAGINIGLARAMGILDETVEPRAWKGQTKKPVQNKRDKARLSVAEEKVWALGTKGVAASKKHNVTDAVGIGLWAVGRGNKKR